MSVTDTWPPKRPGPASDRGNVTRQTLRAGIHAPPLNELNEVGLEMLSRRPGGLAAIPETGRSRLKRTVPSSSHTPFATNPDHDVANQHHDAWGVSQPPRNYLLVYKAGSYRYEL